MPFIHLNLVLQREEISQLRAQVSGSSIKKSEIGMVKSASKKRQVEIDFGSASPSSPSSGSSSSSSSSSSSGGGNVYGAGNESEGP